jgi:hypothetical protein
VGRVDVALEEYRQLRAEILSHAQARTTVVTIALTATAAIAGVAFGTGATGNPERLEILLALPLILIGLGLTYLAHSVNVVAIGRYIGDGLWPALAAAQPDDASQAGGATVIHSWEKTVASGRGFSKAAKGIKGLLSWVPGVFLFGLPSIAALAINYKLASLPFIDGAPSGLEVAWLLEAVAVLVAACMLGAVGGYGGRSQGPRTDEIADHAEPPLATLEIKADLGGHHAAGTAVLHRAAEPPP